MLYMQKNRAKVQANYLTKKRAVWAVILISLLVVCWMVFSIYQRIQDTQFSSRELPYTQLFEPDNGAPYSMAMDKKRLLVFFKTDCPYCELFAKEIINYKKDLKNIEILFISSEQYEYILEFSLSHYSEKIVCLCDETALFSKELKVNKYPTTFIYNGTKQRLTKQFIGAVPLEQILREIGDE